MATPAPRKTRARRPFAVVASLSAARNRVMPRESENVVVESGSGASTFAQRLQRLRKLSGEQAEKSSFAAGRSMKKSCSTPVSMKPAARTPRPASRRRPDSSSRKVLAPVSPPYDAPRAPLWDFSDEHCQKKVRARLSSPYDDDGEEVQERRRGEEASRKRTTTAAAAAMGVTLEEAMAGLPEPGDGRVRYLVDTFERLLSLSGGDHHARGRGAAGRRPRKKTVAASPSPPPSRRAADEMDTASYPSAASSEVHARRRSTRRSISSNRDDHQLRRCNSVGSLERSWSRKVTTNQQPFNLRTEQRGKVKEYNFVQRMRMMMIEEARRRNPLAQGLPWTTDEPEILPKPPAKEPTEPFDVVLHSAFRAVGRARFDRQIAERSAFLEKLEMEKEEQQRVDEQIEIRQLRKEQVPKAHRMPDFSNPFVPRRSVKPHTVPREPRFHPRLMRHSPKA